MGLNFSFTELHVPSPPLAAHKFLILRTWLYVKYVASYKKAMKASSWQL